MVFICATTLMVNLSGLPWNNYDVATFLNAQIVCAQRYKGCIKRFRKHEKQVYDVICGDPE